jgi:ABC-type sugar transport system ATPase subunit
LPAHKRGNTLETSCGTLTINPSALPDGPVLMSIRPEAVQFGPNGANTLTGTVTAFAYQGDSARYKISLGDTDVQIVVPPFASYRPGEQVTLHFPREHIWLMPVDERS